MPRGVICWVTLLTRPSRLVVVPFFSANAAAGKTTSAFSFALVTKVSTLMTLFICDNACLTSIESATSASGFAPSKMRQLILPAAAFVKISIASPEFCCGVRPTATAPRTLPRRKTGRILAFGIACNTSPSACKVNASFSAKFARPNTTTTSPRATCSLIS